YGSLRIRTIRTLRSILLSIMPMRLVTARMLRVITMTTGFRFSGCWSRRAVHAVRPARGLGGRDMALRLPMMFAPALPVPIATATARSAGRAGAFGDMSRMERMGGVDRDLLANGFLDVAQ